jgi:hypothetical protein
MTHELDYLRITDRRITELQRSARRRVTWFQFERRLTWIGLLFADIALWALIVYGVVRIVDGVK